MNRPMLRTTSALILLTLMVAGLAALRIAIDRAPDGTLGLQWPEPRWAVFRWKAMTACLIVGSALAVSGVLLQALLRNPLASPFILGLSSGAGLAVALSMYLGSFLGWSAFAAGSSLGPAVVGSLATLAVVYLLGQRRGWIDPISLVLMGIVVSAICGALTMFVQHISPVGMRDDLLRWMFGRIPQNEALVTLIVAGAVTGGGVVVSAVMGRAMDAATLGDDEARSIGLHLGALRLAMFTVAGILAATAVAIAGPIGFVGIIAPHAARIVVGPRHTILVVAAALLGMAILLAADISSQAIYLRTARLPVGVFTALLGGPAFIWLLRTGRGQA